MRTENRSRGRSSPGAPRCRPSRAWTRTAALSVAQIVTSVVVSPVSTTLGALGRSQQFTAVAQDRNGKTVAGQVFSWSAAPTGVATIDPATGLATTVANGLTTITATTGG